MFELLAILFIGIFVVGFLKLIGFFVNAGIFVLTIPFKIIGAVFGLVISLILLPVAIFGALFSLALPLLVVGLVVAGLVHMVR